MQLGTSFVDEMITRLKAERAATAEKAMSGSSKSHEEYAHLHGRCTGLATALRLIDELLHEKELRDSEG